MNGAPSTSPAWKHSWKRWIFRLLGKSSEAVVVTFCSGPPDLCRRMAEEVRSLVPDRRHFVATTENWPTLKCELKPYRIGLAPVMLANDATPEMDARPAVNALRRAAYCLAPHKILAYNSRLERHHLRLNLSSLLFWRGVPLDRIYLRPWWWPWTKREHSEIPAGYRVIEGRPCAAGRSRVAVLSPYFPFPLSHGGAVRIYNLLREISEQFDVELFAFTDAPVTPVAVDNTGAIARGPHTHVTTADVGGGGGLRTGCQWVPPGTSPDSPDLDLAPILEFCARVVLVQKPRYREPRWSSLLPPEVHEFRSPAMHQALQDERRAFHFETLQVEYTQLAEYPGDILVEHDVTFDLFTQIAHRELTLSAAWDAWRWRRFEAAALRRFPHIVVMSDKDAEMVGVPATVIPNGVDLARFQPEPEIPAENLLFIGSFRHFPNIAAYRFFTDKVWPLLRDKFPNISLTVVCGADYLTYWRAFTNSPEPAPDPRIRLLGFVSDVRPLYVAANLVLVPTTVSAGTNVKVLEAMAMRRAVVSTTSGCAGLGLLHGHSVWIADTAMAFAAGVATLIKDPERRQQLADAAYTAALRNFDWNAIGEKQRALLQAAIQE